MKKVIAILLVAAVLACVCATAFAQSHAILYWNEEKQIYEIRIIYDGPDIALNPEAYQEFQNPPNNPPRELHPGLIPD